MFRKIAVVLLFLPLYVSAGIFDWSTSLSPKAEKVKELLDGFDAVILNAIKDCEVPGIAVGVVVDGHVIFSKGFGYRDIENKRPVTSETLFAIGSCTKAFTTFAIGTLVDEGLLFWDEPVINVLPEFRLWNQYATTNLTIRDLLTHRSGMPRHELVWYNSKMTKSEMLKRIRYLQPSQEIRQRYQYGNLMYFTAGLAMEEVSGKSWEDLIREKITGPLEMKATNFSVEDTQRSSNFASPYIEKDGVLKKIPFRNLSLIGPAGAINSNVENLLHWVQMILGGGVWKGRSLISPVTLQEIQAPQVIIPGVPETKESLLNAYAMGWGVNSYRGHTLISHDGVSDGFTSVVAVLPSEGMGIVVLSNKNMSSLSRYLSLEIIDRLLNYSGGDWIQAAIDSIRKNKESQKEVALEDDFLRKKGTSPSHELEDYTGVYENPGYGQLVIELIDGTLQANYNDLLFDLGHWHYDVFRVVDQKQDTVVSFEGTKFTFSNNALGDIAEIKVPFEPSAEDIVFEKKQAVHLPTLGLLNKFKGIYEVYGYTVEIAIKDRGLVALVPGQPQYELVPVGENEFTVKEMMSATVRFILDDNEKVKEVLLIYPYGAFSATPVKQRK